MKSGPSFYEEKGYGKGKKGNTIWENWKLVVTKGNTFNGQKEEEDRKVREERERGRKGMRFKKADPKC